MKARKGPFIIGIMGGVASGKSAAASFFAAMGAKKVDADEIASEALEDCAIKDALAARFGRGVIAADGSVDRARLADAAFEPGGEAVSALNGIMHPAILARVGQEIAAAGPGRAVVLDLPLLFETGLAERCDLLVFIDAPEEARGRFAAIRGWSGGEAARREAAQAPLGLKQKNSGITIKNDKTLDDLRKSVENIWRIRVRPHLSTDS